MATMEVQYATGVRKTADGQRRLVYVNDTAEFGDTVGKEVLVHCEDPECDQWFVRKRCPLPDEDGSVRYYFAHAPEGMADPETGQPVKRAHACRNNGMLGMEEIACDAIQWWLQCNTDLEVANEYRDGREAVRYPDLSSTRYADLVLRDPRNGRTHYVEIVTSHSLGHRKACQLFEEYDDAGIRVWRIDLTTVASSIRHTLLTANGDVKAVADVLRAHLHIRHSADLRRAVRYARQITMVPTQYTEHVLQRRASLLAARHARDLEKAQRERELFAQRQREAARERRAQLEAVREAQQAEREVEQRARAERLAAQSALNTEMSELGWEARSTNDKRYGPYRWFQTMHTETQTYRFMITRWVDSGRCSAFVVNWENTNMHSGRTVFSGATPQAVAKSVAGWRKQIGGVIAGDAMTKLGEALRDLSN